MVRKWLRVAWIAVACAAQAASAAAQSFGGYELSAGVSWTAPISFGVASGSLIAPTGAPFNLFSVSSRLASGAAAELRLDRSLSRAVDAELAVSYSWSTLTAAVSEDAEGAAATEATDALRQLVIGAGGRVYVGRWRQGDRIQTFVSGGGGYVRQLHENRALVESGGLYWLGGGLIVPLRPEARGAAGRVGLRVDARVVGRSPGVMLDRRTRLAPAVGASWFTRF